MTSTSSEMYHPGLEGVIAGETAVSTVEQDSLAYRGYSIQQLADQATFEETAYLLLQGELPTRPQLQRFMAYVDRHRELPGPVIEAIRAMPAGVEGMDVLRTAVSMRGHFEIGGDEALTELQRQAAVILACVPSMIAARMRLREGRDLIEPKPGLSHAAQFYWMAYGKQPGRLEERILDLTLILYAEHEFNASTFAARVCASTLSDMWSSVVAAIGTLKGPLHGGANEEVVRMLEPIKSVEEARKWTLDAFANKRLIMGFGHRVYKHGDHRARILEPYVEQLGRELGQSWRVDIWHEIRKLVWEHKKLHPNLDYPCGMVYYFMGLPLDIYTPLFVASRVTGWCAHYMEQREHNRLIRPRSRYIGPPMRDYLPIDRR